MKEQPPVLAFDVVTKKLCSRCGKRRRLTEFAKWSASPDGLQRWCRGCMTTSRHGITLKQFKQMLKAQKGKCAICGTKHHGGISWHIDHDHSCCPGRTSCGMCVRGLLCRRCNSTVLPILEGPLLSRGLKYLESFQ